MGTSACPHSRREIEGNTKGIMNTLRMQRFVFWLVLVAVLAISISPQVAAQAVYGSIVGTVTDSSGAAVPTAKITITDIDRQVVNSAAANGAGWRGGLQT